MNTDKEYSGMKTVVVLVTLLVSIFSLDTAVAVAMLGVNEEIINELDKEIQSSSSPEDRAIYFVYKARNYFNSGDVDAALKNYNEAVRNNNKEWIILERCPLLLKKKLFDDAYADSRKLIDSEYDPDGRATWCYNIASKKLKEIYDKENPPTIIMNTQVDPNRKSRFDVARERRAAQQVITASRVRYDGSIERYCRRIVGESYSLMETCIKREQESKRNVSNMSVSPKIMSYCSGIVSESYSLMETCIKREQGAKSRLRY